MPEETELPEIDPVAEEPIEETPEPEVETPPPSGPPVYRILEDDEFREEELPQEPVEPEPEIVIPEYWEDPDYVDNEGEVSTGIKALSTAHATPDGYLRTALTHLFKLDSDINLRALRITFREIQPNQQPVILKGKDYIRFDLCLYGKPFTQANIDNYILESAKHLIDLSPWIK